jgi:hypothetical protein
MIVLTSLLLALSAQAPEATLTTNTASTFSNFGETVATSGNWAFVGAPDDSLAGQNYMGSVIVYEKTTGGWVERQKLTASNGVVLDTFGGSIAADGDRVVIGAPNALGNNIGSAYVFKYDGSTWVEEQILSETVGWGNDWFGSSVDIQGNRIVVGSMWSRQPGLNWGGPNTAGAAWVFVHNGTSWVLEQELSASDKEDGDHFGSSICLDGTTLIVGASGEGDSLGGVYRYAIGAAYVFNLVGGTWVEAQKLRASNFEENSEFSSGLALEGNWLLVGCPGKTGGGIYGKGACYMFKRTAGTWAETQKIETYGTRIYGHSVAMSGDLAVIASSGSDQLGHNKGAVHPIRRNGNVWIEEPAINPGNLGTWDLFAQDVDLDGTRMLTCGYIESMPSQFSPGAGFVYNLAAKFHMMIAPYPLDIAEDAKLELRFAAPNATAWMAYSLQGLGATPVPPLGVTLGIANALRLATPLQTDATGYTKWEMPLPAAAQGVTLWFQGLQAGQITNVMMTTVQ